MINQPSENDILYMTAALRLAERAAAAGEVPVGAVIVHENAVIAEAYNERESRPSALAHAELDAIGIACQRLGRWRLSGCTLYVTLEPCMMCISVVALARIERVVFGAQSPLFGYHLDTEGVLALYTKQIKNITTGVCAEESLKLLQEFFTQKRTSNERKD